ncbi:heparinase II/III family protein [Yoonia sp.]|uniref:heparinase II/III family protein n=1 Tax=Yoonia sp. TaxID=2212373 RepID=UPI002FDA6257
MTEAAALFQLKKLRESGTRFMHRHHARRAARVAVSTSFVAVPDPRTIGVVARGKQLIDGHFLFSGLRVEGPKTSIWDVAKDNPEVRDQIHGCVWLDDLAALGDELAREKARLWVREWLDRYGDGRGAGWTPGITGRRLIRLINHGYFIMRGQDKQATDRLFRSMGQQTLFLARRWKAAQPGLRRFEALAGLIYAGLTLKDMAASVDEAVAALAIDCDTQIDAQGGIATRNPEELLEVLGLLNLARDVLTEAGRIPPPSITSAILRIAPVLRALRHADGSLARFHGGGAGIEGRLDAALAAAGVRSLPKHALHMGYARLSCGRTTVIVDAAAPPTGETSVDAHASTLALEMTSGRRPLIVNCGSGRRFGKEWRRASRATPSHSTMMIEGVSSSHLSAAAVDDQRRELLVEVPRLVRCNFLSAGIGRKLELAHDGYQASHGITHARVLTLSVDGATLKGDDIFTTLDKDDEARFDKILTSSVDMGIPFAIRFHLHPDVTPHIDTDGTLASLQLASGETWVFRHDGTAKLSLSASVYLQNGRLKPRATQQMVLSGHALAYATRIRWSLSKAPETPGFLRDVSETDPMDLTD